MRCLPKWSLFYCVVFIFLLWYVVPADVTSLKIAIVDYTDSLTQRKGLALLLKDTNTQFTDITDELKAGKVDIDQYDTFIIGSFATSDETIRTALHSNKKALQEFVRQGKTIVIFAQSCEDESIIPWFPEPILLTRSEKNYNKIYINLSSHILLNEPNRILPVEFSPLKSGNLPLVLNAVLECAECEVIASRDANARFPAIVVTGWGKGRVLVIAIPLDKFYILGDEGLKNLARRMMENILHYCIMIKGEEATLRTPRTIKPSMGYSYTIEGVVYLDRNGNNQRDEDEPPLANIPVSDGQDIVFTDKKGRFLLPNATHQARFVFVCTPRNYIKSPGLYYLLGEVTEKREFHFGLRKSPVEENEPFTFLQITDVHVNGSKRAQYFERELQKIDSLSTTPAFIVSTGDLVNNAQYIKQIKYYLQATKTVNIPIFNVIGNHDRNKGKVRIYNYVHYCGPDYYSFDYANTHNIVFNIITPTTAEEKWLKKDIELLGKDKLIMFFQHYPPKEEQLRELASLGVDYMFVGHWHSTRFQSYGPLRLYAIPPLYLGGIDISPSGFLEVKVDNHRIYTTYHYRIDKPFLNISSPGANLPIYSRDFDIVVESYDSAVPISKVSYQIIDTRKSHLVREGVLQKVGAITWRTPEKETRLDVGKYLLKVSATNIIGKELIGSTEFDVLPIKKLPSRPRLGQDWTMFMGSPEHSGLSEDKIRPPLVYQWSFSTGGWVDLASPIVADGKVFIATKRLDDSTEPRIFALDSRSGEPLWQKTLDMPVEHTLAYADGKVVALCQDGTLIALDASTGETQWQQSLGSRYERWIFSAPVVKDGVVYCGNSAWFSAIDLNSGSVLWTNQDGYDWISSYASPAVANDNIITGAVWLSFNKKYGSLYAMSKKTGKRQWFLNAIGFHSSPAFFANKVFCTDTRGILYELNHENGNVLWRQPLESGWATTTPVIKGNYLIAGSGQGTIYCFKLPQKELCWELATTNSKFNMSPYQIDFQPLLSSPVISGDLVFIGSGSGSLYAIRISDGKVLWQHDFGVPVLSTPAISGNCLFTCTSTGTVFCLTMQ
ncbi:PQQ-binding-like beta-propeller repeat protein [Candidatus Sumerlaeota bacterium]|nr:PQQ-binding-like beta-propeller repeat protein [Candidatus Sumerlaeota bacterium]